jgi:hypothetical protein
VAGAKISHVFRTSRFSNLAYQMDCLSGVINCSREAYELLWRTELGGLSEEDKAALGEWGGLKHLYRGQVERVGEADPRGSGLPLRADGLSAGRMLRIAGYRADSQEDFVSSFTLFAKQADVERAKQLTARFEARFAPFWSRSFPLLVRAAKEYAAAMTPDVLAIADRAAVFYGAQLPNQAELPVDLVARPEHASKTRAELVGDRALVEVVIDQQPRQGLHVLLHEQFHFLHWSAKRSALADLALRLIDSEDPPGDVAYGLLDEAVATALATGVVLRTVDEAEFRKRVGKPLGFYGNEFIDAVAQALLPSLETHLAEGRTIHDPIFADRYLDAVKRAFPSGPPPRAYLQSWLCVRQPELNEQYVALRNSVQSTQTGTCALEPGEVGELLRTRERWARVILLRNGELMALRKLGQLVGGGDTKAIERRAAKRGSFVYASVQPRKAPLFVFVGRDATELDQLIIRFKRLDALRSGVIAE